MPVEIIAQLARKNGANFPLAAAEDVIGAFATVASTGARDAIPTAILRTGAIVRIGNTSAYYEWNGTAWVSVSFGGGGGTGDVVGPASSVTTRIATFSGTTGKLLADGGQTIAQVIAAGAAAAPQGDLRANGSVPLAATWPVNNQSVTQLKSISYNGLQANATTTINFGTGALQTKALTGSSALTISGLPAYTQGLLKLTHNGTATVSSWTGVTWVSGSAPVLSTTGPTATDWVSFLNDGTTVWGWASEAGGGGTIADNAVTMAKLADLAGLSVIGRSAGTSGDPAAITATTDQVLRESGGALGFGTIASGAIAANAVTLAKMATQAALTVLANATNGTAVPTAVAAGVDGQVFCRSGTTLAFSTVQTAGIADDAVTYAKIQNVAASGRVLGRFTASSGNIEEGIPAGGVEATATGIQLSTTLPARGTKNTAVDLAPSVQAGGTIATAASITQDQPISTNKWAIVTFHVRCHASNVLKFLQRIQVDCQNVAGTVTIDNTTTTSLLMLEGAVWTLAITVSTTNVRATLTNTSGSTRTYAILSGKIEGDL